MKTSDFDFHLLPELLAEYPARQRDHSRLMVIDRKNGGIEHRHFYDIHEYFLPGDLLVRNNTRVKPVRFLARKETLRGALLEVLLVKALGDGRWEIIIDPLKKVRLGTRILFGGGELRAVIENIIERRYVIVRFEQPENFDAQEKLLKKWGKMPIPRYIRRLPENIDFERYQTVFAREETALAAPTSALHFTHGLFEKIKKKGIRIGDLMLEIGLGTFNPVYVEKIEEHKMHSETFVIPAETARLINDQKTRGHRVVALGTTTIRATEAAFSDGQVEAGEFATDIFIYPPYEFRVADALITNFHTPRSTLLMLVSAFAGYELIMRAYREAIKRKYRFFSYGDAMLIL